MGSPNTVSANSSPPPEFLQAYKDLLTRATGVANQPLQQYSGNIVAGLSPDQQAAIKTIQNTQGIGTPYLNSAAQLYGKATDPLTTNAPAIAASEGDGANKLAAYARDNANTIAAQGGLGATTTAAQGQEAANQIAQGAGTQANRAAATDVWSGLPTFQQGIAQYMSPYNEDVVNATQRQFANQNAQAQQGLVGKAISSGAWGGDRAGVAQGILAGQEELAQAPVIAQLRNQGFQQGTQEFNTQQALQAQLGQSRAGLQASTALGAGQLGSGTELQGAGLGAQTQLGAANLGAQTQTNTGRLGVDAAIQGGQLQVGAAGQQLGADQANRWLTSQAAAGMAGLGQEAQGLALQGAQAQLGVGGLEQQVNQEQLNVPYQQFLQQQAYPYQTTQWLSNLLQGVGGASGGSSSTTSPGADPWSQLLGLGALAGGAYLASDRRAKEAIAHVGTLKDGQKVYRFRYKGDPTDATHIGLMAQEVEKRHPEAVAEHGGLKMVDYHKATRDSVRRADGGLVPDISLSWIPSGRNPQGRSGGPPAHHADSGLSASAGSLGGALSKYMKKRAEDAGGITYDDFGDPGATEQMADASGGLIAFDNFLPGEMRRGGMVLRRAPGGPIFTAGGIPIPQLSIDPPSVIGIPDDLTHDYGSKASDDQGNSLLPHTTYWPDLDPWKYDKNNPKHVDRPGDDGGKKAGDDGSGGAVDHTGGGDNEGAGGDRQSAGLHSSYDGYDSVSFSGAGAAKGAAKGVLGGPLGILAGALFGGIGVDRATDMDPGGFGAMSGAHGNPEVGGSAHEGERGQSDHQNDVGNSEGTDTDGGGSADANARGGKVKRRAPGGPLESQGLAADQDDDQSTFLADERQMIDRDDPAADDRAGIRSEIAAERRGPPAPPAPADGGGLRAEAAAPFDTIPHEGPKGADVAPSAGLPAGRYAPDYTPRQAKDSAAEDKRQALALALVAGGAGALGRGSHNFGTNLGAGLNEGVRAYVGITGADKARAEREAEAVDRSNFNLAQLKQRSVTAEDAAKKLSEEMDLRRQQLKQAGAHMEKTDQHAADTLTEQQRHNQAVEGQGTWQYIGEDQNAADDDKNAGIYLNTKTNEQKRGPVVAKPAAAAKDTWDYIGTNPNETDPAKAGIYHNKATNETKPGVAVQKPAASGSASLSPEAVHTAVEQYLAGDKSAFVGFGRSGPIMAALREETAKEAAKRGMKGGDIAAIMADFAGNMAGSRALGTMAAKMDAMSIEARQFAQNALKASDEYGQGRWVPINRVINAYETNSGDPQMRAFGAYNNSLVNAYTNVVSRGVPSDTVRNHAYEMLNTADGPVAYRAVVGAMMKEIDAALASPEVAQDRIRARISGAKPVGGAGSGDMSGKIPTFKTPEEAAKSGLPRDSVFYTGRVVNGVPEMKYIP